MAEYPDLERRLTVRWLAERPFQGKERNSSCFSMLGRRWSLRMKARVHEYDACARKHDYCYTITLLSGEEPNSLQQAFRVDTFIQDINLALVLNYGVTVTTTPALIWRAPMSSCQTQLGDFSELKVICMFDLKDDNASLSAIPRELPPVQMASKMSSDFDSMSSDFSNILEHKTYSDVKLICGGRTFPVHKVILSARSEVFAAMFRNPMAESETGVIRVDDLDATLLELFLRYVYSGKISELSEDTASQLYVVGDKYAVVALRKACSDWMRDHLTTENCLHFLVLADRHRDDTFKSSLVLYVAKNLELLDKGAWAKFYTEHPTLAVCVYNKRFLETSETEQSAKKD